jgi:mono/diheme cytochrome c family protein
MSRTFLAAITLLVTCGPAFAAKHSPSEAAAAGHRIAIDVCSGCHVVAEHQPNDPLPTQRVPSFQEIADDPKSTRASLRHFITTTHWDETIIPVTMPNQLLVDPETDDVAA